MYKVKINWHGKVQEAKFASQHEALFFAGAYLDRVLAVTDPDGKPVQMYETCLDSEY